MNVAEKDDRQLAISSGRDRSVWPILITTVVRAVTGKKDRARANKPSGLIKHPNPGIDVPTPPSPAKPWTSYD